MDAWLRKAGIAVKGSLERLEQQEEVLSVPAGSEPEARKVGLGSAAAGVCLGNNGHCCAID